MGLSQRYKEKVSKDWGYKCLLPSSKKKIRFLKRLGSRTNMYQKLENTYIRIDIVCTCRIRRSLMVVEHGNEEIAS